MAFFQQGIVSWGVVVVYLAISLVYGAWIKAVEKKEATGKGED